MSTVARPCSLVVRTFLGYVAASTCVLFKVRAAVAENLRECTRESLSEFARQSVNFVETVWIHVARHAALQNERRKVDRCATDRIRIVSNRIVIAAMCAGPARLALNARTFSTRGWASGTTTKRRSSHSTVASLVGNLLQGGD